ncbi:hypothetical protein F4820DRAFT_409220 [Hypoxylon rubiginosum]|uniref:Uncharacterized protein n=1 Tax=Hypoxylon rubiginosum TaxID=110542 RepID=A0ACB9ZA35_9PEZI|nr:hypothetical protein F4820DRAFT_409220 [Hypoxylon rubiginosum]
MQRIITLDPRTPMNFEPVSTVYLGREIKTAANAILPPTPFEPRPYPWLDPWLETLVALYMSTEREHIPSLPDLTLFVQQAVVQRNHAYYGYRREEHDAMIRRTLEELMYTTPPS